jgi:glycerophosphoryl diester phosphodiesterase
VEAGPTTWHIGAMRFDLQAHRGGLGLTVENTLAAFARSLEVGVSTLEFDVQITRDGHAVVAHDSDPTPRRCRDTGPAFAGDPAYPYVGGVTHIRDLTLAQVRTIDCGSVRHPDFPDQALAPGARMPVLAEVADLLRGGGADDVRLNVELKVDAAQPERTAPREEFVEVVVRELRDVGLLDRTSIESFDWAALRLVRGAEASVPTIALGDVRRLQLGRDGASPWLGGVDADDLLGSPQQRYVAAAASAGVDAVSPDHRFTSAELVDEAHEAGLGVIPYTVNDPATMGALIEREVDGLITDRPDLAREVMAGHGLLLPA